MNKDSRIVVFGGTGFLGKSLTKKLRDKGYSDVTPIGKAYDLREYDQARDIFFKTQPEVVFHLAATVGGIGANRKHPAIFWYDNLMMGMNLLSLCQKNSVKRVVMVGTTCSYPKFCQVPFREEDIWNGFPEETNAPYGVAKKALMVGAKAFRQEYGLDVRCPVPTNLYGPNDHYSLEDSHVIPAMIQKFHEGKVKNQSIIELWGDGSPTRDFLHVSDAAEGITLMAELHHDHIGTDPVNFGSGREVSMMELAEAIKEIVEYRGKIHWDVSKPNGQPRRLLDISKATSLGWKPKVDFKEGLRETYEDYLLRLA
jgi:GDP-L-fucose synthase